MKAQGTVQRDDLGISSSAVEISKQLISLFLVPRVEWDMDMG